MTKSCLLCTFTTQELLEDTIDYISNTYDVLYDKIFVLRNTDNFEELFCTYNVDLEQAKQVDRIPGTISLHRKKHTNTLYTINALNKIILELNNGVQDSKFPIPWENYQNCILVTDDVGLNRIDTVIHDIVSTNKKSVDNSK